MSLISKLKTHKLIKTPFWSDRLVLVTVLTHSILNIAQWLFLYFGLKDFKEYPIPIHYTVIGGVDTLGDWYQLFIFPFAALLIGVINLVLAILTYKKEKLLSYFFVTIAVFLQILLIIISLAFLKLIRG